MSIKYYETNHEAKEVKPEDTNVILDKMNQISYFEIDGCTVSVFRYDESIDLSDEFIIRDIYEKIKSHNIVYKTLFVLYPTNLNQFDKVKEVWDIIVKSNLYEEAVVIIVTSPSLYDLGVKEGEDIPESLYNKGARAALVKDLLYCEERMKENDKKIKYLCKGYHNGDEVANVYTLNNRLGSHLVRIYKGEE